MYVQIFFLREIFSEIKKSYTEIFFYFIFVCYTTCVIILVFLRTRFERG